MLKSLLNRALETKRGDSFALIRMQKRIARRVHEMLGSPLAPKPEKTEAEGATQAPQREPAPVMVYMEKDRNLRERTKIEDTLRARNISYKLLDVSQDPSTKSFVVQAAQCEEDDLP